MPIVWAGSFAFYLSFYLLLSVVPLYARDVGVPDRWIGLVIGSFAFASMSLKPWAGWASDRLGRRPLMVAGASLFLVASLAYGIGGGAAALVAIRLVHGSGMGLYPTAAAAVVADIAPPDRRGEMLGLLGAAANVAMALGPLAGNELARLVGFATLFVVSAAIAVVAIVLASLTPETATHRKSTPLALTTTLSAKVAVPSLIVFCLMLSYGVQISFLPLYASGQHVNPGLFFLVFAVVVAAVRQPAGRISDTVGRTSVASAGLVITAAGLATLALRHDAVGLALAGALYGVGFGTAQPALMAWCVDAVAVDERGRAMGTYYGALELGIAAGAMSSGLVVSAFGFAAAFFAAAATAVVGAVVSLLARPPRRGHAV